MYRRICSSSIQHIFRQNAIINRRLPKLPVLRQYCQNEPPGDQDVATEVPLHDPLWIQLKGYDFTVLESFAKYAYRIADTFGLDTTAFPVPARTSRIQIYKPFSGIVESEYNLALYERVVQVENLSSTLAPILIELLQTNIPAGVEMTIKPPDPEEEEFRYVPDLTLLELKAEVAELEKIREDRKKK